MLRRRPDHFQKHGAEFLAATEIEYEEMADEFLGGALKPSTMECKRAAGDIVRYDQITGEFGILAADRTIRSYFKRNPKPSQLTVNIAYFRDTCAEVFP